LIQQEGNNNNINNSGDVDMTKIIEIKNMEEEKKTLTLLSGRTIEIPKSWNSSDGKFHLGLKKLFDLYPSTL
jgi:tripeptidyl-peptidase-2